jgi:hypothetical protein
MRRLVPYAPRMILRPRSLVLPRMKIMTGMISLEFTIAQFRILVVVSTVHPPRVARWTSVRFFKLMFAGTKTYSDPKLVSRMVWASRAVGNFIGARR